MPTVETIRISDHFHRAIYFIDMCRQAVDLEGYNWNLLAGVYSGRAIVEIVNHSIRRGHLSGDPDEFMADARAKVRRFKLIETIRVQDFHRGSVQFSPRAITWMGPATAKTSSQRGSFVSMSFSPEGKVVEHKVRNASITYNRPLAISGLSAHDSDRDEMIQADVALEQYLIDLKFYLSSINEQFEKDLSSFFSDRQPNSLSAG